MSFAEIYKQQWVSVNDTSYIQREYNHDHLTDDEDSVSIPYLLLLGNKLTSCVVGYYDFLEKEWKAALGCDGELVQVHPTHFTDIPELPDLTSHRNINYIRTIGAGDNNIVAVEVDGKVTNL